MALSHAAVAVFACCALWLHGCGGAGGPSPNYCRRQRIANGTINRALEGEPGRVVCDAGFVADPLAVSMRCVDLNGSCVPSRFKTCRRAYGFEAVVQLVPGNSSFGGVSGVSVTMGVSPNDTAGARRLGQNATSPMEFGICLPQPDADCPPQRISNGALAAASQGNWPPTVVCDAGFTLQSSALSGVACTSRGYRATGPSSDASTPGASSGPWAGPSGGPATPSGGGAALCAGCCQAAAQQLFEVKGLRDALGAEPEVVAARRPSAAAPLLAAAGLLSLLATAAMLSMRGERRAGRGGADSPAQCHSDSEAEVHLLAVEAEDRSARGSDDEDESDEESAWE